MASLASPFLNFLPPRPLPLPPRDDSPWGGWREHPRAGPHECHFSLSFRGLSDNAKEVIMQRRSGNFVGRIQGAKGPFDLQFLTWDFS